MGGQSGPRQVPCPKHSTHHHHLSSEWPIFAPPPPMFPQISLVHPAAGVMDGSVDGTPAAVQGLSVAKISDMLARYADDSGSWCQRLMAILNTPTGTAHLDLRLPIRGLLSTCAGRLWPEVHLVSNARGWFLVLGGTFQDGGPWVTLCCDSTY